VPVNRVAALSRRLARAEAAVKAPAPATGRAAVEAEAARLAAIPEWRRLKRELDELTAPVAAAHPEAWATPAGQRQLLLACPEAAVLLCEMSAAASSTRPVTYGLKEIKDINGGY